jgi:hypothetical protein
MPYEPDFVDNVNSSLKVEFTSYTACRGGVLCL